MQATIPSYNCKLELQATIERYNAAVSSMLIKRLLSSNTLKRFSMKLLN